MADYGSRESAKENRIINDICSCKMFVSCLADPYFGEPERKGDLGGGQTSILRSISIIALLLATIICYLPFEPAWQAPVGSSVQVVRGGDRSDCVE